jgi:hypothetical protein
VSFVIFINFSSLYQCCCFLWVIVTVVVLVLQKANGGGSGGGATKFRPPKSSSKSSSSVQDEIEIEIAEVLYGMMRQPQSQVPPSKQEMNDSMKMDSRETNNNKSSASDAKSRISSPPQNSSSSATPVSAIGLFFISISILSYFPLFQTNY